MADMVLFGAGQIARSQRHTWTRTVSDRVVGFTVDGAFRKAETFAGLPLVAWEHLESRFPPNAVKLLGPLSYRALNELRRDRHAEGKARGYSFASFIHPSSHVYADAIGENAFILEANVVQPFVTVGQGVMHLERQSHRSPFRHRRLLLSRIARRDWAATSASASARSSAATSASSPASRSGGLSGGLPREREEGRSPDSVVRRSAERARRAPRQRSTEAPSLRGVVSTPRTC